jgi:peptidyl-prolyl cis-trans isomerase D
MALGFMRRHRRWLFAFLWLVIAAFIILYIPAFQGSTAGSPAEALATVGGLPITVGEFQRAYLRQRQAYERLSQGRMDPAVLRGLGIENQVFESLVATRLVVLESKRLGLTVSDDEVAREIASSPQFQRNGTFIGGSEIRRLLELQGMSVEDFAEAVRGDLLRRKLESLITDGVAVTPAEAEREYRRRTEQIRAEYVLVDAARYRSQVSAGDTEVKARFEARKDAYRIPEKRIVSYLVLDPDALKARVAVTEGEITAYYEEHKDEFKEPEEVCASHILVKAKARPEDPDGHPDTEARKMAESLLAQIQGGADFAVLAKKSSEDKGSAERGGDLGCFPRGQMVPEFDNAAFSLGPGETSGLVKSSFGYHVIRVASHKEEAVASLGQVKERIRSTLFGQRASALADEKRDSVSAALRRGRSLEDAAKEQGLSLAKSKPLARGEVAEPLASPALVARAFALKPGEVEKEAFPLPRGSAFIVLAEIQPSRAPELAEVENRVKAELLEEKAFAKAMETAAALKARAEKDGLDKAASAMSLVRKETPSLVGRGAPLGDLGSTASLDDAAFTLPDKTLSEPVRVNAGYAVLRVIERKPFDAAAFESQKAAVVASLREERKQQLFEAFLAKARQAFAVERRADLMKRVVG